MRFLMNVLLCFGFVFGNSSYEKVMGITSIIGVQHGVIPLLAMRYNWNNFDIQNPFNNIREPELYFPDKGFHMIGGNFLVRTYTDIFRRLDYERPLLLGGIFSFLYWSQMELLDGSVGNGFSIWDEVSNCVGIGIGILNELYPDFPLQIKIGSAYSYDDLKEKISEATIMDLYNNIYSFTYVECRFEYRGFFIGIGCSLRDGNNLWSLSMGLLGDRSLLSDYFTWNDMRVKI
jgi:hypothetical protein